MLCINGDVQGLMAGDYVDRAAHKIRSCVWRVETPFPSVSADRAPRMAPIDRARMTDTMSMPCSALTITEQEASIKGLPRVFTRACYFYSAHARRFTPANLQPQPIHQGRWGSGRYWREAASAACCALSSAWSWGRTSRGSNASISATLSAVRGSIRPYVMKIAWHRRTTQRLTHHTIHSITEPLAPAVAHLLLLHPKWRAGLVYGFKARHLR